MEKQSECAEVCLLAPSEELTVRAQALVRKLDLPIAVHQVALSDACAKAGELIAAGAKVLISRRGVKAVVEEKYSIPMVGINISLSDYIPNIEQAVRLGSR
ncbi:MAG: PrpR N-terminal domain-containing protein, partial [Pseudoflavonifractor sp.]